MSEDAQVDADLCAVMDKVIDHPVPPDAVFRVIDPHLIAGHNFQFASHFSSGNLARAAFTSATCLSNCASNAALSM